MQYTLLTKLFGLVGQNIVSLILRAVLCMGGLHQLVLIGGGPNDEKYLECPRF
jgi:hypothetical protein